MTLTPSAHLFLHLPRTGGTSLRAALARIYAPSERVFLYEGDRVEGAVPASSLGSLSDEVLASLRLVAGTFPFGLHELLPGPARYITVVRDPLDRTISLFHSDPGTATPAGDEAALADDEAALLDWLDAAPAGADNGMVRLLSGRTDVPFGGCTDDMLGEAIEHVESEFDVVLLRGRLTDSASSLSPFLGRQLPAIGLKEVTRHRSDVADLSAPARRRLIELNRLDSQLFRHVVNRTEEDSAGERVYFAARPAAAVSGAVDGAVGTVSSKVERAFYIMHMASPVAAPLVGTITDAFDATERAVVDEEGDPKLTLGRDAFAALEPETRHHIRVVVGDFPYGLHSRTPVPYSYLAFLREPLQRVLDLYRRSLALQKCGPERDSDEASSHERPMTLEQFVFEQRHLAVDNGMVRAIAARRRIRFGQCPEDLLLEARANIERDFEGLLISEDMQTSAAILEQVLGRGLPGLADIDSGSDETGADEVEPSLAARIRSLNRLDVQLYELARMALTQTHDRLAG